MCRGDRRPESRRLCPDRTARSRSDCPRQPAWRGRARRPRRRRRLSWRVRPSRGRTRARSDDRGHDLRPRVAHQSRRDDDERDAAGGAGEDTASRSRRAVHPRVRRARQERRNDHSLADAYLRTRARSAARSRVQRRGRSDPPRERPRAVRDAGRALRLQRHQLLPSRRHRAARQRRAARSLREGARLRSARHEGHDIPADGESARTHRADRALPSDGVAVLRSGRPISARHRPRSDRPSHGRRRRTRGTLQHGGGPLEILPDASARRHSRRRADSRTRDRCAHDDAVDAGRDEGRARARLGHRLVVLVEPRRAVSNRIVRAHRVHGHVALARSGERRLRRLSVEPRAPRRQGRRHAAARQGRHDCGGGAFRSASLRGERRSLG